MPEYRITYTIERRDDEGDFAEIGFGSSSAADSINSALYDVQSEVENQGWETSEGMPEPADA